MKDNHFRRTTAQANAPATRQLALSSSLDVCGEKSTALRMQESGNIFVKAAARHTDYQLRLLANTVKLDAVTVIQLACTLFSRSHSCLDLLISTSPLRKPHVGHAAKQSIKEPDTGNRATGLPEVTPIYFAISNNVLSRSISLH